MSKDRITVVERIYHQQENIDPTCSEVGFFRELETTDQPYQRIRLKVGDEWQSLVPKGCWIENASMLLVINNEGEFFSENPTDDEKSSISLRILEIRDSFESSMSVWLVPPKESFRGCPTRLDNLQVRCQHGEAKYTLTVFPK